MPAVINAQRIVEGRISDTTGKPVEGASIVIARVSTGAGLYFLRSDIKGLYRVELPDSIDISKLIIKVSVVGFQRSSKTLSISEPVNFALRNEVKALPDVRVLSNQPRVRVKGDTIDYRVSDFSSKGDRTIGDVIRKIPGIEIDPNGRIKYNGKAISNFFIDGDNLLDDKYNIASNTIPADIVDRIQVLENNQPIKMLRGISVPDQAALNITIKDKGKLKLVNNAKIGGGTPGSYDVELNSMAFKNRYKAINSVKLNNVGTDLLDEVTALNLSDLMKRNDQDEVTPLLGIGTAGNPGIKKSRYLFNNATLFNLNNLYRINKETTLRLNAYYLNDRQRNFYDSRTGIFLPLDTISFTEVQTSTTYQSNLNADMVLNINKTRFYLDNKFSVSARNETANSGLTTNGKTISQRMLSDVLNIRNAFSIIQLFRTSTLVEFNSVAEIFTLPQQLNINPGIHESVINNGNYYDEVIQKTKLPSYFFDNNIVFRKTGKYFFQGYKIGSSLQHQELISSLGLLQPGGGVTSPGSTFFNNLSWNKLKLYMEAEYKYEKERSILLITLPAQYIRVKYSDGDRIEVNRLNRFFVNPSLRWTINTGKENRMVFGYRFGNRIGQMQDVYAGTILLNYRTLNSNNSPVQESDNHNAYAGFNFRRTLKIFSWYTQITYNKSTSNTIYASTLSDNITKRIALPLSNATQNWIITSNISKYIFKLRTTLSFRYNYQYSLNNQLQNTQLLPIVNNNHGSTITANIKAFDFLFLDYEVSYQSINSRRKSAANVDATFARQLASQVQQKTGIDFTITEGFLVRLSGEHYNVKRQNLSASNFYFADCVFRYRFLKTKSEIELECRNITNTGQYIVFNLNTNSFYEGNYRLNPRMLLLKVSFSF
jgi:hypothetical protein